MKNKIQTHEEAGSPNPIKVKTRQQMRIETLEDLELLIKDRKEEKAWENAGTKQAYPNGRWTTMDLNVFSICHDVDQRF